MHTYDYQCFALVWAFLYSIAVSRFAKRATNADKNFPHPEQNKCMCSHHRLLHVDVEDMRNLQTARPAEPPDGVRSPASDDTRTAITGIMLSLAADEQCEAEV
jgi:hypothetical protein